MPEERKWDTLVIITHWTTAFCMIFLFVSGAGAGIVEELMGKKTAEAARFLHYYLGWALICAVAIRVMWGFVGDESARWSGIVRGFAEYPKQVSAEICFLVSGKDSDERKKWGHNPLAIPVYLLALFMFMAQAYTGLELWDHVLKESASLGYVSLDSASAASRDSGGLTSTERSAALPEKIHKLGLFWVPAFLIIHIGGMFMRRSRGERDVFAPMIPFRSRRR